MNKNYRPEIDGLRAICILSVLFYHAELSFFGQSYFKGGFVGVDVFFLVSGYLITSHILSDLAKGRFSFRQFYNRRSRRILPALLFVSVVTLPLAWNSMFPDALQKYAGSLLATLFSLSNVYFWREDSYAAAPGAYKPLLHTWSLSVEEQFYLLFPLLLFFIWRYARGALIWVLAMLSVSSLVLAQWSTTHWVDGSFFLLPTRMWELGAGALLACSEKKCFSLRFLRFEKYLPGLGLCLILYAVRNFSLKTPHPSVMTGIPVLGAALILRFGGRGDLGSRLLSTKPLVGIGLISYSLYLWHQPLFAFRRLMTFQAPETFEKILLMLISLGLAFLSWKFIECPFRDERRIRAKPFWICLGVLASFILICGSAIWIDDGVPSRLDVFASKVHEDQALPEYEKLSQGGRSCRSRLPAEACRFGDQSWVTLGDSHVAVYDPTVQKILADREQGLITLNFDQCPFVSRVWFGAVSNCAEINRLRWKEIESWTTTKTIIISADAKQFSAGKIHGTNDSFPIGKIADGFRENITRLERLGHRIVLVYSVPSTAIEVNGSLAFAILHRVRDEFPRVSAADPEAYEKTRSLYQVFDAIPDHPNVLRIYPRDALCPPDAQGKTQCLAVGPEGPYYNVGEHLSRIGAEKVLKGHMELADGKWGR